jgi:hypothetical protein
MDLNNEQLEAIREAARTVEYGSVTVHVSETANYLTLEILRRVRIESEPQKETKPPENGCFPSRKKR